MEIIEIILTNNPCYRAGKKIAVKGLMLHSVGCPQPSAETFVKKWNTPEASRACVHAFIDGNTGKVYQTLPWEHRAWHCGGNANSTHIGVEMCEPACIHYTGGASFTCTDEQAALAVVQRTYNTAVELFAFLCKKFGLNPLEDGVIISHKEGHKRGLASGHGDPEHLWSGIKCGYTMDGFRKEIANTIANAAEIAARANVKAEATANNNTVIQAVSSSFQAGVVQTSDLFQAGSIVALTADAVYYTGKAMPDWVKNDRWIIRSISGDRAVLGKNIAATHEINSPVHIKYLKTADNKALNMPPAPSLNNKAPEISPPALSLNNKAPEMPPPAPLFNSKAPEGATAKNTGEMEVSEKGVALIAKYEGCRLEAYKCPAGVWTIGYGHTAGVKQGDKLPSQEAAKTLLKRDLKKYSGYVNDCIKKEILIFKPNQNQFDALTSFCYNCGNGTLQKLIKDRDAATIADKMLLYNKGGGKALAGLARRREEERALFLS